MMNRSPKHLASLWRQLTASWGSPFLLRRALRSSLLEISPQTPNVWAMFWLLLLIIFRNGLFSIKLISISVEDHSVVVFTHLVASAEGVVPQYSAAGGGLPASAGNRWLGTGGARASGGVAVNSGSGAVIHSEIPAWSQPFQQRPDISPQSLQDICKVESRWDLRRYYCETVPHCAELRGPASTASDLPSELPRCCCSEWRCPRSAEERLCHNNVGRFM